MGKGIPLPSLHPWCGTLKYCTHDSVSGKNWRLFISRYPAKFSYWHRNNLEAWRLPGHVNRRRELLLSSGKYSDDPCCVLQQLWRSQTSPEPRSYTGGKKKLNYNIFIQSSFKQRNLCGMQRSKWKNPLEYLSQKRYQHLRRSQTWMQTGFVYKTGISHIPFSFRRKIFQLHMFRW